jgi:hypothetical protein
VADAGKSHDAAAKTAGTASDATRYSSAGPKGAAIAPPASGIHFIDRAGGAPIQRLIAPPAAPATGRGYAGANANTPEQPPKAGYLVSDSWVSYKAGDNRPQGGVPAADPPGYQYIRNTGLTNLWVRFHLANAEAGGPGTADNLVPTSQKTNQDPEWKTLEAAEKDEYTAGRSYYFAADVAYHAGVAHPAQEGERWKHLFPSAINAKLHTWNGANWVTAEKANLVPNLPPLNPGLLDFDLTEMTAHMLRSLGVPDALARFVEAAALDLANQNDTDEFMERLYDLVADIPDDRKDSAAYKKGLQADMDRHGGVAALRTRLDATHGIKINLA